MTQRNLESSVVQLAQSVAINANTSGDATIYTPVAGTRFAVYFIHVTTDATGLSITFKSGSTAISGVVPVAANASFTWRNSLLPILIGDDDDEAFVINLSANQELDGWAVCASIIQ